MVIQWLRLCTPSAGGLGLILRELDSTMLQLKILCAATKTQCSKINLKKKFFF